MHCSNQDILRQISSPYFLLRLLLSWPPYLCKPYDYLLQIR